VKPETGQVLDGRFRLLHRLANRGADVWRAYDVLWGRQVDVEFLESRFPQDADTTLAERVHTATGTRHPNVATVLASCRALAARRVNARTASHPGRAGRLDECWIATDALEGPTLAEVIEEGGAASPARAAVLIDDVLAGLEGLSATGLVHGSLSPERVVVTGEARAVITGHWSVGQLRRRQHSFIAPEVAAGQQPTARSDLYAVGRLLLTLLAARERTAPDGPGSSALPEPSPLASVGRRALEQEPARRFGSAHEFRQALRDAIGDELERAVTAPVLGAPGTARLAGAQPAPGFAGAPPTADRAGAWTMRRAHRSLQRTLATAAVLSAAALAITAGLQAARSGGPTNDSVVTGTSGYLITLGQALGLATAPSAPPAASGEQAAAGEEPVPLPFVPGVTRVDEAGPPIPSPTSPALPGSPPIQGEGAMPPPPTTPPGLAAAPTATLPSDETPPRGPTEPAAPATPTPTAAPTPAPSPTARQAPEVAVPSLVGLREAAAKAELKVAGLDVAVTPVSGGKRGFVADQQPAAGTFVDPGAEIMLFVSDGSG
jgi:serine/threonine-protein kinase